MIVETTREYFGVRVVVRCCAAARLHTAELRFADGDRAVVDAGSVAELEALVEAVARAAVIARLCQTSDGGSPSPRGGQPPCG